MAERPDDDSLDARRAIGQILGPYRKRIAVVALTSFAAALLEAAFLVIVTRGILRLADGESTIELVDGRTVSISTASAIGLGFLLVRFGFALVSVQRQSGLFQRLSTDLRRQLGHAYLSTSWQMQSTQQRGLFSHMVVQFPASIVSLSYQLIAALTGGLSLLSLLVIAFVIEPLTALVVLGVVAVLAGVLWPVRRAVRRRAAAAHREQLSFATKVSEFADLGLEINALGVPTEAIAELDRLAGAEALSQRRMGFFRDLVAPTYTTLAYLAIVLALVALDAGASNDLTATGAVLLIMLRSLSYGQQLQHGASALGQIAPAANELVSRLHDFKAARRIAGTYSPEQIDRIEMANLLFAYPERPPVLSDANVTIERGQVIGVVGPSGAGKTTFIQLLLGLLEPTSGRVNIDGVTRSDIDPASWSRLVAYVPQETRLLDGTIADNVRFLRRSVSDHDVERALAAAGLELDPSTDLGAAARQFSGGQRQRLAVARALASSPSLLVLDEPTSSLDTESEAVITETLTRLRGEVAVVVVSHRDSTLAACDRVLSIAEGRVTESA